MDFWLWLEFVSKLKCPVYDIFWELCKKLKTLFSFVLVQNLNTLKHFQI